MNISIALRTLNNNHTLAACLDSIYTALDPQCVVVSYPADDLFAGSLTSKFPKAHFHRYPKCVTPPRNAINLPTEDISGLWWYTAWAFNLAIQKGTPRVLKVDGDQTITKDGAEAFKEQYAKASYMGIKCIELTSPTAMTKEFTGEEPRYFDFERYPSISVNRIPGTGYEYIGDITNLYDRQGRSHCWGPNLTFMEGPPMFLHYGYLTSTDPLRPARNLEQVRYSGTHHPLVNLDKVFPQHAKG